MFFLLFLLLLVAFWFILFLVFLLVRVLLYFVGILCVFLVLCHFFLCWLLNFFFFLVFIRLMLKILFIQFILHFSRESSTSNSTLKSKCIVNHKNRLKSLRSTVREREKNMGQIQQKRKKPSTSPIGACSFPRRRP